MSQILFDIMDRLDLQSFQFFDQPKLIYMFNEICDHMLRFNLIKMPSQYL